MNRRPPRILVADSDSSGRNTLPRQLADAGYQVCTTSSGNEVLLLCDLDPPDVLIMDVRLPDMDGFELCERVRRDIGDVDLTVIITTEASDAMTRAYLGQMVEYAGGDYFVAKPCDRKLLLKLLDDMACEPRRNQWQALKVFPTHVMWPTTRPRVTATSC